MDDYKTDTTNSVSDIITQNISIPVSSTNQIFYMIDRIRDIVENEEDYEDEIFPYLFKISLYKKKYFDGSQLMKDFLKLFILPKLAEKDEKDHAILHLYFKIIKKMIFVEKFMLITLKYNIDYGFYIASYSKDIIEDIFAIFSKFIKFTSIYYESYDISNLFLKFSIDIESIVHHYMHNKTDIMTIPPSLYKMMNELVFQEKYTDIVHKFIMNQIDQLSVINDLNCLTFIYVQMKRSITIIEYLFGTKIFTLFSILDKFNEEREKQHTSEEIDKVLTILDMLNLIIQNIDSHNMVIELTNLPDINHIYTYDMDSFINLLEAKLLFYDVETIGEEHMELIETLTVVYDINPIRFLQIVISLIKKELAVDPTNSNAFYFFQDEIFDAMDEIEDEADEEALLSECEEIIEHLQQD